MDTRNSVAGLARFTTLLGSIGNGGWLNHIQELIASYTKLDISTIALILAFFGSISDVLRILRNNANRVYNWITQFFTASISIPANDRLNREVLTWVGAKVLERQETRILTARTVSLTNDAYMAAPGQMGRRPAPQRRDYTPLAELQEREKRWPIQYIPPTGNTWFIHNRNIFLIKRIRGSSRPGFGYPGPPNDYAATNEGMEPLVITCFGRSVAPIKRFLETCRDFSELQRVNYITIRSSRNSNSGMGGYSGGAWGNTVLKPIRPLETVHFDETLKQDLVADMQKYLDPKTTKFYTSRGIPYRRGYLLNGAPGTGKTSLSMALASLFGLDLYIIHLPSIMGDHELTSMFASLPPRCIVLLEDIDAVGVSRDHSEALELGASQGGDSPAEIAARQQRMMMNAPRCTLSGLLNVLDGVASQEGRILIMTSNHAEKLDKALIRPGRIDKTIYLGYISPKSAELMFLRMYSPDPGSEPDFPLNFTVEQCELEKLAATFARGLPDSQVTPAQIQGYLLDHVDFPVRAAENVSVWIEEERARIEEENMKLAEEKVKRAEYEARKLEEATIKSLKQAAFVADKREELARGTVAKSMLAQKGGQKIEILLDDLKVGEGEDAPKVVGATV